MEYFIKQGLWFNGKNFVEDNTIRFYFGEQSIEVTPKEEWDFSYFANCLKLFHSISHNGEDRFYVFVENEIPICEIGMKAFNTLFEIEE